MEELMKKAKEKYKQELEQLKIDKRNAYRRKWYAENAEQRREYQREHSKKYYYKNREELLAKNRIRKKKARELLKQQKANEKPFLE